MSALLYFSNFHSNQGAFADQPAEPATVLFLSSWDSHLKWAKEVETGLFTRVDEITFPMRLRFEYLGANQHRGEEQGAVFARFLEERYGASPPDLIVAESLPAVRFLEAHPTLLETAERLLVAPGATVSAADTRRSAVPILADYQRSIEEMLRLTQAERIFVTGDTRSPGGSDRLEGVRTALQEMGWPENKVEYLVDLAFDALLTRVSELPPESAIYHLLIFQDGQGQRLNVFDATQRLSDAANAPIFSNWSTLVDSGIVGGYLISGEAVGQIIADRSAAILAGDVMGSETENSYEYIFDWRELRRWNIDMDALHPSSRVLFETPSVFVQYQWQLIAIASVMLLLIGITVNQRYSKIRLERLVLERTKELADLAESEAELNKQLKQEIGIKNRLFSIIAHDLRSPFSTILGATKMMSISADAFDKSKIVTIAQEVHRSADRLHELLENLLEWAHFQMKGGQVQPSIISLANITDRVTGILQDTLLRKEITVVTSISQDEAYADSSMVETIIRNLIHNAAKFSHNGGRITVHSEKTGDQVRVTISDNGIGMEQSVCERLFDMDRNATTNGTGGEAGTGLGLPMCKQMIEANGGTIRVESAPGKGSSFIFTLSAMDLSPPSEEGSGLSAGG
ncbi:MAG: HAMP domain-containing sensor histidine kinase [Alphaproteobacteria bacterium]